MGSNPTPSAVSKHTIEEWLIETLVRLESLRDICIELEWFPLADECNDTAQEIRLQLARERNKPTQ